MVMPAALWTIFILTYLGIAFGRIRGLVLDRSGIAMLGAVAMLVVGGITVNQAAHAIDNPTLMLLFGLMIFAAQLRAAGFPVVVDRFLQRFLDRPKLLLATVIGLSAMVSALLANDIVCLAFTPLLCRSLLRERRDPLPYLLALATSSNVGSALTIIGNPQNMYIGSVAHLPFGRFVKVMIVPVLAGLLICWGVIAVVCRKQLAVRSESPTDVPDETAVDVDGSMIGKTMVLVALLIAFFLYAGANANLRAIGALAGACVLLVSCRKRAAALQQHADWNLLLLFIGLFVVNGAMQDRHLIEHAFTRVAAMGLHLQKPVTLSTVTLVLSNMVSNVPAVLLLKPTVASSADQSPKLWYLLSLVSTLAGNLTLLGSIANLIVAESAAKYGVRLTLKQYCKVGIPVAVSTVVIGTAWVMLTQLH
jgi:Na+/H+ antiporter NhaD/arsenite permease-like protein